MDAKEIRTIMSSLDKTTDDGTILKLLSILQKNVKPTEQLLRETKVGVAVNKLRTSTNAEIGAMVKKVIKSWKDEVSNEKKSKTKPAALATPAPSVTGADKAFVTERPRNPKNDGVSTELYSDTTRNATVAALYTALAVQSTRTPKQILHTAELVEREVFRFAAMAVSDQYRNKCRSLIMNIRNKNNPELREQLLTEQILAAKVVTLPPAALAPESLKKEIEELQKKNLFDAQGATEKRAVTDRFTCGKCKEKKVSYYQMQTRSADEPLTTFCTCENCGNRWKFS